MKKIIKFSIIILTLLILASCSPDPRVAPFKAWIVGVEDATAVLYDEDYGTRIIIMEKGEDVDVEITHNREPRHKVTIGTPRIGESTYEIATITDLSNGTFRIHAVDDGCAKVTVQVQGEKVQYLYGKNEAEAYVYVIVEEDTDNTGIKVVLAETQGYIDEGDISSKTFEVGDEVKFTYTNNGNITDIYQIDWYIEGEKAGEGAEFTYIPNTVGTYSVRCIVHGRLHGKEILGDSNEVQVRVTLK